VSDNLTRESSATPVEVSVVIPMRNAARTVSYQLAALASQDYDGSWEVVLADNGSEDDSVAVAAAFSDRLPAVRVVNAAGPGGAARARNVGVQASSGECIIFLDADDQATPSYVRAMIESLSTRQFVAAAVDHTTLNRRWKGQVRDEWQVDGLMTEPFLPCAAGGTLGVRRTVFNKVGGFDESFVKGQDDDFCWRVQLAGVPLDFVPEAVVQYRARDTIWGHFQQERKWGIADVALYLRFRPHGFPAQAHTAWRRWARLAKHLMLARSRSDAAWCLGLAGRQIGRLQGSALHRVWYP
jgi:glycosyltransferase involved in cell wall biosynthesis